MGRRTLTWGALLGRITGAHDWDVLLGRITGPHYWGALLGRITGPHYWGALWLNGLRFRFGLMNTLRYLRGGGGGGQIPKKNRGL